MADLRKRPRGTAEFHAEIKIRMERTGGETYFSDFRRKIRREEMFFLGVAAIAVLGFILAFSAVWLVTSIGEDKSKTGNFFVGGTVKNDFRSEISSPPFQSSEEDDFLPSSITDLFSSSVYIASTSKEIVYSNNGGGSYSLPQGTRPGGGPPPFIESVNLNNYDLPVLGARISEVDLKIEAASVSWFLSNDGIHWNRVKVGDFLKFDNKNGRLLFWRAEILPGGGDPFFSLDRIRIDYGVKNR